MFVALRELRTARGRFSLITVVVALLALLVAGLSGLTGGLAHQNISALVALGDLPVAVNTSGDGEPDPDRSVLEDDQVAALTAGSPQASAVGISRVRMLDSSGQPASVVVLGLDRTTGELTPPPAGTVQLSPGARRALGDADTVSANGAELPVSGSAGDLWHAHGPVVVTDLDTWRDLSPRSGAATLVAGIDRDAAAPSTGSVQVVDTGELLSAMPSYQAEQGSLTLMSTMLMVISALVVGAFFTVWGIQRRTDIAILKALGAATRTVLIDSLGQAALVLIVGVGAGVSLAALAGLALPDTMPYIVTVGTTVVPGVVLISLGLIGAAASLRPVLAADPTTALGALR